MLLQERQTTDANAFSVKLKPAHSNQSSNSPTIKRRLADEAYKAAYEPSITLEQIAEKLKKAEEKRRINLANFSDSKIHRERRRHAALDQRKAVERVQADQLKEAVQTNLMKAAEKRSIEKELRLQKLRRHITKVQEVCRDQAARRKASCEHLRKEIFSRLDSASLKRELQLEAKKNIAIRSAEKKMQVVHDGNQAAFAHPTSEAHLGKPDLQ